MTQPQESLPGQENLHCNWGIARGSAWISLRDKNYSRTRHWWWEDDILLWLLLPGVLPGSHSEYHTKKFLLVFLTRGREKEPFWNKSEHSVLLNKVSLLEKIVTLGPSLQWFCQSLTDLGEGKYSAPAPSSHVIPLTGGGGRAGLRNTWEGHSQETQVH